MGGEGKEEEGGGEKEEDVRLLQGRLCVYFMCCNVCLQQLVFLEQVLHGSQIPTTVL